MELTDMKSAEEQIKEALAAAYVQGLREGLIQGVNILEEAIRHVEEMPEFKPPGT